MKTDVLNRLYKPFDKIKSKPGRGYKYIPSNDVINRMNKVFDGNWSSEVIKSEMVEGNILITVRVTVKDNGDKYYHDGFGSNQIARFTFGDNKGKPVNIGNNYNSAKSLAIKDACKKWGVALYLEGEEPDDGDIPENIPETPLPSPPPPQKKVIKEGAKSKKPVKPSIPEVPSENVDIPSIPGEEVVEKPAVKREEPMDIIPDIPLEVSNDIPSAVQEMNSIEDGITDVQKVAIQSLTQLKGIALDKLLEGGLGRADNLPDSSDPLTYQEAVSVIKFGNNCSKK